MSDLYKLKVASLHLDTPDTLCITFAVPSESASLFAHTQGQYLTLAADIGGSEVRRSYSISSAAGGAAHCHREEDRRRGVLEPPARDPARGR